MMSNTFPEIVRAHFAFMGGRGFTLISNTERKVRYESNKVYVEISKGERDCEVAISFGRLGAEEEYSFALFLRKVNPAFEKQLGERLAVTADQTRECVSKLAHALQADGAEILRGNDIPFDEMKEVRWWHFQPEALKKNSEHRPLN